MKKIYTIFFACLIGLLASAQDVAMDFTQDDCNGNPHHLFAELEENNVVILEFFMNNCTPCVTAGNALMDTYDMLLEEYPGHVKWYHFGYNNTYNCDLVSGWVDTHGFNSTPFTNGAAQVAYYGGFGMPTVVVVGGASHEVIFAEVGYSSGDADDIYELVTEFFAANPLAVEKEVASVLAMNAFYNSATQQINLQVQNDVASDLTIEVCSLTGQAVLNSQNVKYSGKEQSVQIDAAGISNGVYIIKLTAGTNVITQRISVSR